MAPRKIKAAEQIDNALVRLRVAKLDAMKFPQTPPMADERMKQMQEESEKNNRLISWMAAHDLHITMKTHVIRMRKEDGGLFVGYSSVVDELADKTIIGIGLSPMRSLIALCEILNQKIVVTAYFNGKSARVKF